MTLETVWQNFFKTLYQNLWQKLIRFHSQRLYSHFHPCFVNNFSHFSTHEPHYSFYWLKNIFFSPPGLGKLTVPDVETALPFCTHLVYGFAGKIHDNISLYFYRSLRGTVNFCDTWYFCIKNQTWKNLFFFSLSFGLFSCKNANCPRSWQLREEVY